MALSPGYVDYALELLAGLGPIEAKRMFGGAGIYHQGVMFALLDDDAIYVRVDDALQADLAAQGSTPWVYSMKRDGAVRDMGYWRLPETAADDADEAGGIARRAYAAAVSRQALRKPKSRSTRTVSASGAKPAAAAKQARAKK